MHEIFLIALGSILILAVGSVWAEIAPSVAATDSTFFLSSDGTLLATGLNTSGQLGVGDRFSRSTFQPLSFPPPASRIWSGPFATYVLKSDGTLLACGSGDYGLLGNSNNVSSSTLVQAGVNTDWKEISPGYRYVLAIKNNGTLWVWGFGSSGALGLGIQTQVCFVPTQIGSATDWKSVAAGEIHNLAIKTNGTLWAWGENKYGQVGDGTSTNIRSTPVQVGTLNGWKSVSAGSTHSLAIRADGSLWAWGANSSGQLGDNSTASSSVPIRIGTSNSWKSVSAGSHHSLGQLTDNTLQAWGNNDAGQLDVGNTLQRNSPTSVGSGETWLAFDAGVSHSAAIRTDGTLWVWGAKSKGQLGPPATVTNSPQPANLTLVPKFVLSVAVNPSSDSDLANSRLTKLAFPLTAEQNPVSKPVHLINLGTAPLSITAITLPAGFSATRPAPFTVAAGTSQVLTTTLGTSVTGDLAGQLVISSDDPSEPTFPVNLSGIVLSLTKDTDGDGLNDAAEWYYSSLGFRWESADTTLVAALKNGVPHMGLHLKTPDALYLKANPANHSVSLKLGIEDSEDLSEFVPLDVTAADIASDGSVEVTLAPEAKSGFFRFTAEPLPPSP